MNKKLKLLVVAMFIATLFTNAIADSDGNFSIISSASASSVVETVVKKYHVGGGDCYIIKDGKPVANGKSVYCLDGGPLFECTPVTCGKSGPVTPTDPPN